MAIYLPIFIPDKIDKTQTESAPNNSPRQQTFKAKKPTQRKSNSSEIQTFLQFKAVPNQNPEGWSTELKVFACGLGFTCHVCCVAGAVVKKIFLGDVVFLAG